ncbi:S1C family serine protease [Leifsonia poae]|uniref:S1C family serine protease n=1 Tax=Leifsonia poae TaxID=110933 RepID=UPI001CBD17AB|nr:trypsin-like peptidase domain-containing protein [Leifsonia poae]
MDEHGVIPEPNADESASTTNRNVTAPQPAPGTPPNRPTRHLSKRALIAIGVTAAAALCIGSVGGTWALTSTLTSLQAQASSNALAEKERNALEKALAQQRAQSGQSSDGSGSASGAASGTSATAAQSAGIVTITSQMPYQGEEGAGTGMVLTSSGEILTNNHVVEDSTSLTVTVVSTGQSYSATVVGTDLTDDIAVLQLSNASGLTTAKIDTGNTVATGDGVTAVGNAGGTGSLTAATGTVAALDQTITTQSEATAVSETLNGLIETNADILAGDSGGPLYDANGGIIGIDTAASSGGSQTAGFAIPINSALGIAQQIEAGAASSTVTIGYPAFLGVEVAATPTGETGSGTASGLGQLGGSTGTASIAGAPIADVVSGGPAEAAGLVAGDTITAVDGAAITSASDLTAALKNDKPGQSVSITWTDSAGQSQTATVTLTQGPAA